MIQVTNGKHLYIGDTKLDEFLIQAQDSKGEEFYVNKYGEIKPENEIEPQLIARGVTKLFNIDSLNNKQKSNHLHYQVNLNCTEVVNWKIPGQRVADALADDTKYTTAQISNSQCLLLVLQLSMVVTQLILILQ